MIYYSFLSVILIPILSLYVSICVVHSMCLTLYISLTHTLSLYLCNGKTKSQLNAFYKYHSSLIEFIKQPQYGSLIRIIDIYILNQTVEFAFLLSTLHSTFEEYAMLYYSFLSLFVSLTHSHSHTHSFSHFIVVSPQEC